LELERPSEDRADHAVAIRGEAVVDEVRLIAVEVAGEATGVAGELRNGDRAFVVRHAGKPPAEAVRGSEDSIRFQPEQGGSGELLGDRSDVEQRRAGDRRT